MAESIKQRKDLETKIHDCLYNNLLLLTKVYPPTNDFIEIFKKNMFVKNNKGAFHQTVYYLLNILNSDVIKKKITTWPPYDFKSEAKFRNEILTYLNELNSFYEWANIPIITKSHLISPGGYKFVTVMLKLSELVMFEHLKKTEYGNNILYPLTVNTNMDISENNLKNIKSLSTLVDNENRNDIDDLYEFLANTKHEENSLNEEIIEIEKNYKEALTKKNKINITTSMEEISKKMDDLKRQIEFIESLETLAVKINNLTSYLSSTDIVLEHDPNNFKMPHKIEHLIKNKHMLDLNELLLASIALLEVENFSLPNYTTTYLNNMIQFFIEINEKLKKYNIELDKLIDEVKSYDTSNILENNVCPNIQINSPM